MTLPANAADGLPPLLAAMLDARLSEEQAVELQRLVRDDPASRREYVRQIVTHTMLQWAIALPEGEAPAKAPNEDESVKQDGGLPIQACACLPAFDATAATPHAAGYYFAGWPVAYLVATVIFAVGLVIGGLVHVSQPGQLAVQPSRLPSPVYGRGAGGEGGRYSPSSSVVARITAMVDCTLDDDECKTLNAELGTHKADIHHSSSITQHSPIHLGDRIALRSGLLEISYDTGARVILQGPVTYEVESPAGGYLSIGKLTAKLEQKSAVRDQKSASANQKSEISNQKFAVRTPTALVTDLGTEFGVEVDKDGVTRSRVFTGRVRVQAAASDGTPEDEGRMLHENDSIQVDHRGLGPLFAVGTKNQAPGFIRSLPKLETKNLDLVDVVAGGDGFSDRRSRGIDATTGDRTDSLPARPIVAGDHQYHRAASLPFVDGVFIPDGGRGPVQVNSAGQTFSDFGPTNNLTWGPIWAGTSCGTAAENIATKLAGVDYGAPGHAALFLHANKGITFDLDAVRRSTPRWKPLRFSAVVGNSETISETARAVYADVRVLIDAQVRFQRRQISQFNGAFPITIPIGQRDRFLTLAATDGGNGSSWDFIIFGDPRLELAEQPLPDRPMHGEKNHDQ